MSHTKGEAERVSESITVNGVVIAHIAKTGRTEEEIDNGERLVKCWNCHDDLLEVVKPLLSAYVNANMQFQGDQLTQQAEQAIAKVENS